MSDLSQIFGEGAKVVISPDKMRAWITLPPPPRGVTYTVPAVEEWLPQNGVVHGADQALIRQALNSGKYDDLLEVARGKAPVAPQGGDYTLKVDKKPFTGLAALGDGSLVYDDLSFLQEVQPGQVLAEVVPAVLAENGITVTGEEIAPRGGTEGRTLEGSGFSVSEDGTKYLAPSLAHVNIVNDQLVVTPLKKLAAAAQEDGPIVFDGNLLIEGDVTAGAVIEASGSVFVAGRAVSASIKAGNNILLCGGMRNEGEFGRLEAKGSVWGQFFESCHIKAGGDICANHLAGCEATAGGRANILGGKATISSTNLYAQGGVVAGQIGDGLGGECTVAVGLTKDFWDRYETVNKKIDRLGIDIQALQQNITAHERINRMKADKGRNDTAYKDMLTKREQSLSVLNILNNERTRLKRTLDSSSNVSVIVRGAALPGSTIVVDARRMEVQLSMQRTKFRRAGETVEAIAAGSK